MKRFLVMKNGRREGIRDSESDFQNTKNLSEGRQVKDPEVSQCYASSIVMRGQHLPLSQHTDAECLETSLQSVNVK